MCDETLLLFVTSLIPLSLLIMIKWQFIEKIKIFVTNQYHITRTKNKCIFKCSYKQEEHKGFKSLLYILICSESHLSKRTDLENVTPPRYPIYPQYRRLIFEHTPLNIRPLEFQILSYMGGVQAISGKAQYRVCKLLIVTITLFSAEKVSSLGKDWHRPCLKCQKCNKTLSAGSHAEVSIFFLF